MTTVPETLAESRESERRLLEQAFTRAAGGPLITGNSVRLLRDAAGNYPAWLDAIAAARHTVHFETYIIWDDASGATFADALSAKARDGVQSVSCTTGSARSGKRRSDSGFDDSRRGRGARVQSVPRREPVRLGAPRSSQVPHR